MQSSRDAPLSSTATEPALVCQGALSSRPSGSQPENHVAPGDVDWKLERRPDSHAGEENDTPWGTGLGLQDDGELSAEEIQFLEEFPGWEKEQEKAIAKLHALADDADSTHQKFTKANVVACSISVISGVASVLGLALTPLTAGGSLILTSASQGVGLTASVINTVAELMEKSYTNNSRTQSSQLVSPCDGTFQEDTGEQTASYVRASGDIVYKCGSTFQVIRKHIRALRLAKAHPHLVPAAKHLQTAGQVTSRVGRHAHKAFKDTPLVMSQKALLKSGAWAVVSLGYDMFTLQEKLKELKDKESTVLAEELRSKVLELEEEIFQMKEKYKALQKKKVLREERLKKSSLKEAKETQTQLGITWGRAKNTGCTQYVVCSRVGLFFFFSFLFFLFFFFVCVGSHYTAQTCSDPPDFCLPSAGVTGMQHHAQCTRRWGQLSMRSQGSNPGPCTHLSKHLIH